MRVRKLDIERDANLIGLFPGSRRREVRKIFPILIETAHELHKQRANLRFEVAAASEALAQMLAVTAMLVIASFIFYWR